MSSDRDDPLAHTATAPSAPSSPEADERAATLTTGSTVGRYRIERELGTGGMGVVYLAYDPDLERRVALKVLRTQGDLAAKRLLREARAMARLSHPNVVTVHEVGSASGRDFVAMELVEGTSLHEWLRTGTRAPEEVLAAFVAAGRGLAAAHAAGIVHRDFKPHNVLRSRAGRICVTDFGLARSADADGASDPLAETQPITDTTSTPSSLAGLTHTGSVLGTPAYMAPEQWRGATVSPASDQFAFCVAMWEALAGARPFPGPTLEDLRAQVEAGPTEEALAKLPRALRPVLARGLEPDPARRWPSMDALLAALTPRRSRVGIAAAGALVLALGAGGVALAMGGDEAPACPVPAIDPSSITISKEARGKQPVAAEFVERDLASWHDARASACKADATLQPAQLACLDGALARLQLAATLLTGPAQGALDVGEILVDPKVCLQARPPVLAPQVSDAMREIAPALMRPSGAPRLSDAEVARLLERTAADPCAHGFARLIAASHAQEAAPMRQHREQASVAIDRCEDERVRADLAIGVAGRAQQGDLGGGSSAQQVRRAEAYVARVPQADLMANVDLLVMHAALRAGAADSVVERADAALAGLAARGRYATMIHIGLQLDNLRTMRGREEDLAVARRHLAEWRELARDQLAGDPLVTRAIDRFAAMYQFSEGDIAGAHARLEALREERPLVDPVIVRGIVVDEKGEPVAGAEVWTGQRLVGSEAGVAIASPEVQATLRKRTTGPDGRFEIDAAAAGAIVAQHGELRSLGHRVADTVELRLLPTSRIEGTVDLRGTAAWRISIAAAAHGQPSELLYGVIAPVRPDGTFSLGGVPRGPIRIQTMMPTLAGVRAMLTNAVADKPVVTGLRVALPEAGRTAHLVIRSTVGVPLANAQVFLIQGTRAPASVRELVESAGASQNVFARPVDEATTPQDVRAVASTDDLFAAFPQAPSGPAMACAVPLPQDLSDPGLQRKIERNYDRLVLRCAPVPEDGTVVVLDTPPWPRLD